MAIYRTQLRYDYPGDGGPGYNALHFRTPGPITDAGGLADANAALNLFASTLAPVLASSTQVVVTGVWSPVGQDGGLPIEIGAQGYNGTGGDPLPEFVCGLIDWRTLRAGRSGRGRSFISPLGSTVLASNGNLTPTARTRMLDAAEALTDFNAGGANGAFGVYSRTAGVISDFVAGRVGFEFASLTTRRD